MADDDFKAFREYMNTLNWSPSLQQRMRHDLSDTSLPSDALPSTPAFDPYEALAEVQSRWEAYPLNTPDAAGEHFDFFLKQRLGDLKSPLAVYDEFMDFLARLFINNDIYLTQKPETYDRFELERLKLLLSPAFTMAAEAAIEDIARQILKHLPPSAFSEPALGDFMMPLCELTPYGKYIPSLLCSLTDSHRCGDQRILRHTNAAMIDCIYRANNLTAETFKPDKHKLTFCVNAPGSAVDAVKTYLPENSRLSALLTKPISFHIPSETFASHGIIIAPPGHGKTQLLSTLIARFISDEDTGMVVLDPHGDLFTELCKKVPHQRLIVLDPSTNPPPLNVFDFGNATDVQILQAFSYLMSALTGGMSDKQAAVLPYLLKLIRTIPDATVETLLQIVTDRSKEPAYLKYVRQLQPLDRDFFLHQFIGKMQETKDAIAWKLSAALSYDAFRSMFATPRNSFDAFRAMQEKKIVLVKGSESVLGEYGLPVFLQFIVAQFFLGALKRDTVPQQDRSLFLLFADEASHVFNSQTTRILTECRKYRLGFMAATQVIQQIPQDVKAAIYGATAIKIAGPVSHTDAMMLAREMYTTADEIRSCRAVPGSHANWMLYASNTTQEAVKISVPYGALDRIRTPPPPDVIFTPPPTNQPPPIPQPFPSRDTPLPFSIGEWVLVIVEGITPEEIEFANTPRRITNIQTLYGTTYYFVEGVTSAALEHHLKKSDPPQSKQPQDTPPTSHTPQADPLPSDKSDVELVITAARRLETLLEKFHGAVGRGLHEKLTAVEDKVPAEVMHRARYVATMRNNVLHVDNFSLPDRDWFLQCARAVEAHLNPAPQSPPKPDLGMREPD